MIKSSRIEVTTLEISDIVKTTADGVTVIVKKTGKKCHLPYKDVDFLPGLAIIPVWLFDKIYNQRSNILKTIMLSRSDFKEPTAEADIFEDVVLESLGIPEEDREDIDCVDITVDCFDTI